MTSPLLSYEYVALRCVPRVDRDEFINVGVVIHSQSADFLECAFSLDPQRLRSFSPHVDLASVEAALETLCAICRGEQAPAAPCWRCWANGSAGSPHPAARSSSRVRSTAA